MWKAEGEGCHAMGMAWVSSSACCFGICHACAAELGFCHTLVGDLSQVALEFVTAGDSAWDFVTFWGFGIGYLSRHRREFVTRWLGICHELGC